MDEDDRDGHHAEHQGGDEARGEAGGERNAAKKLDEAGEKGERGGQPELGREELARRIDAVAAEPAEQFLRAVRTSRRPVVREAGDPREAKALP